MADSSVMKDSILYRQSFVDFDGPADAIGRFSSALDSFRDKVSFLVSLIQEDMRDYTVHDISHLDALWEMASIIAPEARLNPAEAYVFGGAVLLHDAGMTLAAYPEGLGDLMKEPVYSDALAYYSGADLSIGASEAEKRAAVEALRILHADRARSLATQRWMNPATNENFGLIDNAELEAHYGEIIGRVAASHHWSHDRLLVEFREGLGALSGCPIGWTVDVLKVALLLRCADAIHIDHRRAPLMAYALRRPVGLSGDHWKFQNRLAKPHVSDSAIIYTSTRSFSSDDADAWYLAYDAIRMIDGELRAADEINVRLGADRFLVNGVRGADSPESLAQYIKVDGWRPLPVSLRVSDVTKLARTIGGADLYNYPYAPLRELIQNAADALEARLAVDRDFDISDARILVSIREVDGRNILTVHDNGVGMSERTLTSALLDFGSSFWRSADAREEMPGIGRAIDKMRGKYGIGFFSVFMWANDVRVSSRRFRDELEATRVLEFKQGLSARPLVRVAQEQDRSSRWTTRISLELKVDFLSASNEATRSNIHHLRDRVTILDPRKPEFWTNIVKQIGGLLPFVLEVEEGSVKSQVSVPDWKSRPGDELISIFSPMFFKDDWITRKFSPGMVEIHDAGQSIGRAFLMPSEQESSPYSTGSRGVVAIYNKGIFVNVASSGPICGFIEQEVTNAARDRVRVFSFAQNSEWVKSASISAFGICDNEAEVLGVQRSLASISAPDESKPLFIFQREICSYTELLERASRIKRIKLRLKQRSEDSFFLASTNSLDPLYALSIDQDRAFALIALDGQVDRDSDLSKFWQDRDDFLSRLIGDLVAAVGAGAQVKASLYEVEGYRNDYMEVLIKA